MPTYEYQCTACGQPSEAFQKITDAPLTECPHCHQATLTKLVSAAGFQLKGSGWYITDYSKKSKSKENETKTNTSTETKTDSTKSDDSGSTT
jgi:putative FmdB family regulatory protein